MSEPLLPKVIKEETGILGGVEVTYYILDDGRRVIKTENIERYFGSDFKKFFDQYLNR